MPVTFTDTTCTDNAAHQGGGGCIMWDAAINDRPISCTTPLVSPLSALWDERDTADCNAAPSDDWEAVRPSVDAASVLDGNEASWGDDLATFATDLVPVTYGPFVADREGVITNAAGERIVLNMVDIYGQHVTVASSSEQRLAFQVVATLGDAGDGMSLSAAYPMQLAGLGIQSTPDNITLASMSFDFRLQGSVVPGSGPHELWFTGRQRVDGNSRSLEAVLGTLWSANCSATTFRDGYACSGCPRADEFLDVSSSNAADHVCRPCPDGASCTGEITWAGVKPLFGWWRDYTLGSAQENPPVCLLDDPPCTVFYECDENHAACLGAPNVLFEGMYVNASGVDLSQVDSPEGCNTEMGHINVDATNCTSTGLKED